MANNNLSATSTTSAPVFVPRIVMIATYDQSTQTRITQTINNYIQTVTPTLITSATQTRPFQSNQMTQTYPQQNTQAVQTDFGLNGKLTLDSSDSSTSTDLYDESVSISDSSSNKKRKSIKDRHSIKRSQIKQRKQVTFAQVHHDPSEVSDKTSSEISPILETYEQQLQTFQSSNTFETLDPTSTPSSNQPTTYHNESQPMTTHQRAALAQAALVNFFGEAGTVTSILNRVQPSHTQTLNEVSDEQNLDISQQGRSFPVSTQTFTIPRISPSTYTDTQQSTNRQSYKVPHYYTDSYSSSDTRRVSRHRTHDHRNKRKHSRKDDRK